MGQTGPGLFAYLRGLRGGSDSARRRDVIATVFQGFSNRMESGYLLRDVVNLVDGIHFHVSEEVHTLGRLYEISCCGRCGMRQVRTESSIHASASGAFHG